LLNLIQFFERHIALTIITCKRDAFRLDTQVDVVIKKLPCCCMAIPRKAGTSLWAVAYQKRCNGLIAIRCFYSLYGEIWLVNLVNARKTTVFCLFTRSSGFPLVSQRAEREGNLCLVGYHLTSLKITCQTLSYHVVVGKCLVITRLLKFRSHYFK
jgi:hypothetical protein